MSDSTHLEVRVDALIDQFRARKPIRTGALVITLFGDLVAVRGGSLWLGSLLEIMAGFELGGGLVRTSMTRLVADGWLERRRAGRRSFYRFTPSGRARSLEAAGRIYAGDPPGRPGAWRIVLLPGGPSEAREALRKELALRGFAGLGPAVMVAPRGGSRSFDRDLGRLLDAAGGILIRGAGEGGPAALRQLALQAWDLPPVRDGYQAFIARFGPIRVALNRGVRLDGFRALLTRLLLIHEYRRVLLRDPGLPLEMLPPDWPGIEALAISRDVYRGVAQDAEGWITAHCVTEAGPLPPPEATFFRRLGGLSEGVEGASANRQANAGSGADPAVGP